MPEAPRHVPQHPRRPPQGGVQQPRQPRPPGESVQQPRPPSGSRAERRAVQAKRSRLMQVIVVVAVLALLVTAAFFFLRGGDDGTSTGKTDKEVTIGDLELVVGAVYNANAGAPAQLPVDIQNAVMTTLGSYVKGGVMDPVRKGEVAEDIASLFDGVTAPRLEGPDRAVLLEEGLPERTGNFEPVAQPVILSALSDAGGAFQLVTATVNYSALFETEEGQVRSNRYHELTMRPDEGGTWKITSYDIVVIREGPGDLTTTTTAAA